MKICAIICEYNPFHNGHLYQIQQAKAQSHADTVLCLMSGNFVQRGEIALLNKYERAKHAVLGGADAVLELPTVFATSNAELFAKGAISILSKLPVDVLCFGAENADKAAFMLGARYLSEEPKDAVQKLKDAVQHGKSYAKARAQAFAGYVPYDLLCSPNNILGLEYTKAILQTDAQMEILPIARVGSGYRDENLQGAYSSATAIRTAIANGERASAEFAVPSYVYSSLPTEYKNTLFQLEKLAILQKGAVALSNVCDCTEGLENAFWRVANENGNFVEELTSARYTSSRIRRIALQNLLGIRENLIRNALKSNLYLSPLACNKDRKDLFALLGKTAFPLLSNNNQTEKLTLTAKECLKIDEYAERIFAIATDTHLRERKDIFI